MEKNDKLYCIVAYRLDSVLWFSQQWMKTKCSDQSLAMHWSKEQDYAQIRAFFSKDREISKQEIQTAEEENERYFATKWKDGRGRTGLDFCL